MISADIYQTKILTQFGVPPPRGSPKNQFFEWLNLGCQFVLISADIQLTNNLT